MGRKKKSVDFNVDDFNDSEFILDNQEDIDITEDIEDIEDIEGDDISVNLSSHTDQGKHSLEYDSIFKGRRGEEMEGDEDTSSIYYNESYEVDKGSILHDESMDNENYIRQKSLKTKVYSVLYNKTDINFLSRKRRIPSKIDFNTYFHILRVELREDSFSNVELFNELTYYFTDNLSTAFKLLENRFRMMIISELNEHVGKRTDSREVTNRNIHVGTEIEFIHTDIMGDDRLYTGVVIKTDYTRSEFKVDSYENVYNIHISDISKILNNTKFKSNLSKLNNIDFL